MEGGCEKGIKDKTKRGRLGGKEIERDGRKNREGKRI